MQHFAKLLSLRKLFPQLLLPDNYDNRGRTVHARWRNDKRRLKDNQFKPQCEALSNEILDATFYERLVIYFRSKKFPGLRWYNKWYVWRQYVNFINYAVELTTAIFDFTKYLLYLYMNKYEMCLLYLYEK